MYHAHHGSKLVLVWPPTTENLERLGTSLLTGPESRPLDALQPFTGGATHILRPGERLLSHLNASGTPTLRERLWYKRLLSQMVSIGLELKTPSHLGSRLRAFEQHLAR
jgi:hypothetical protein